MGVGGIKGSVPYTVPSSTTYMYTVQSFQALRSAIGKKVGGRGGKGLVKGEGGGGKMGKRSK